jgi:hypothetical protein
MKLPELRLAYCLLPLIALAQPATAITNSRSLPSALTNPRLISKPNHRSIAKNLVQCAEGKFPVTVEAPNGNSPSYAGKLGDRVDPMTRCIFFKDVSLNIIGPARQSTKPKRTWLIIHGWLNNSESGNIKDPNDANIKKLAETVAQQRRGDRVLILDWGEAAMNRGENGSSIPLIQEGQGSIGVYYAASWIRPVAEVVVEQLKSKYGLTGEEAANNLNIIGHSLGTLMAAEIGGIYFGLNPQGNKTGEGVPIKSIIALDPPSELSTNGSLPYNLGGYDVDGRTPAYIFKDKTLGIWSNRELRAKEIDRPKHFDRVSSFSRAFVGSKSIAGNQEFAGWAHESFQMDFGSSADTGGEHGRVVRAFDNLISQQPFKQPASNRSFLDLDDLVSHSDCTQKGFIKCNAYQKDHEGVITVDSKNLPTMVQFNQSGTFAEVRIKPNEQYSYYINPSSPDSVNKAYSVTSLGGIPQIEVNNFIQNSRMTGHEDVNVTLGEGRAEITTVLTKNTINFIGTGEIITRNQKKWQIAAASQKPKVQKSFLTPDPIFNSVIPSIRSGLPKDMVMRLPSSVPKAYSTGESVQLYADPLYAASCQRKPKFEIINNCYYAISLRNHSTCNSTGCIIGDINVGYKKPIFYDSDTGTENKDKETAINIRSGLRGYYVFSRHGSSGHHHHIYWKQDNLFFEIDVRDSLKKDEVIKMANSMSIGQVIRSSNSQQSQSGNSDKNTPFQVCLERNAWVRPSLSEQKSHLASN